MQSSVINTESENRWVMKKNLVHHEKPPAVQPYCSWTKGGFKVSFTTYY